MSVSIIIIGGGWSGCAAALAARQQKADVTLIERTDMLLGTGLVGGIMRNNGRFTATEELIAMGGGELFELIDRNLIHRNINFPGHRHASLYNVATIEPAVRQLLTERGVHILLQSRITDVSMNGGCIRSLEGSSRKKPFTVAGDMFVDATGTAGPTAMCTRHGNGCAMCILRCPAFGGRVSVTGKCNIAEMAAQKPGQTGAMSGSCKLHKESLSHDIRDRLNNTGMAVIAIPDEQNIKGKLEIKACQQYALDDFEANVILLDTGHAKLMTPYFPLELLRRIPGFENARFEDPYAGGVGNSVRFTAMAPRDDCLKVNGMENLFCAGEKAGLFVGHTEAICTGTLAGYNAARPDKQGLTIPDTLAIGDAISHVRQEMTEKNRLDRKYTFSGSVLFERMKEKDLYTTDITAIKKRVARTGLANLFSR
ncbi:MAG: FAD-dependent oxidoreductase [Desulfotignum sp.]|nr:FAD-dependent oxidoreductase [Desulfotignum sp.]